MVTSIEKQETGEDDMATKAKAAPTAQTSIIEAITYINFSNIIPNEKGVSVLDNVRDITPEKIAGMQESLKGITGVAQVFTPFILTTERNDAGENTGKYIILDGNTRYYGLKAELEAGNPIVDVIPSVIITHEQAQDQEFVANLQLVLGTSNNIFTATELASARYNAVIARANKRYAEVMATGKVRGKVATPAQKKLEHWITKCKNEFAKEKGIDERTMGAIFKFAESSDVEKNLIKSEIVKDIFALEKAKGAVSKINDKIDEIYGVDSEAANASIYDVVRFANEAYEWANAQTNGRSDDENGSKKLVTEKIADAYRDLIIGRLKDEADAEKARLLKAELAKDENVPEVIRQAVDEGKLAPEQLEEVKTAAKTQGIPVADILDEVVKQSEDVGNTLPDAEDVKRATRSAKQKHKEQTNLDHFSNTTLLEQIKLFAFDINSRFEKLALDDADSQYLKDVYMTLKRADDNTAAASVRMNNRMDKAKKEAEKAAKQAEKDAQTAAAEAALKATGVILEGQETEAKE